MLKAGASSPLVLVPRLTGDRDVAELKSFVRAHATVTLALERWCRLTGLSEASLTADVRGEVSYVKDPPPEIAADLRLRRAPEGYPIERVLLRRVELRSGTIGLVDAENWVVPDRLPSSIVHDLDQTATPFGRLIAELGPTRIDVRDIDPSAIRSALDAEPPLFAQQAVICSGDGVRLAVVRERFLPALIGEKAEKNRPARNDD